MTRWRLAGLVVALAMTSCSSKEAPRPPRQLMTPVTRLIYHGGGPDGVGVFTFCDRGNRIYMSETAHFQVVAGGCPDGAP